MPNGGCSHSLLAEAAYHFGVFADIVENDFNGVFGFEEKMACFIDLAHTAGPDTPFQQIAFFK
jgi:hypothetical protein